MCIWSGWDFTERIVLLVVVYTHVRIRRIHAQTNLLRCDM